MECRLYKQTAVSYTYIINNSFYLIVPKLRVNPDLEVVIEEDINSKLDNFTGTSNIVIARVYEENFLKQMHDEFVEMLKLKSLINHDLSLARQILDKNKIAYGQHVILNTPFEAYKKWYEDNINNEETFDKIKNNIALPDNAYKNSTDTISARQKRIEELNEIKQSISKTDKGNETGKKKKLSTGHTTYVFNDGFINVVFIAFVTLVVTVGTVVSMLLLLK